MPYLLRLLLLASTVLSLRTARWAYLRGQAQPIRPAAVRLTPASAAAGPRWLPCGSWENWPVPATYQVRRRLVAGTRVSTL